MNEATLKTAAAESTCQPAAFETVSERTRPASSSPSILFEHPEDRSGRDDLEAPSFFTDLNCDQLVNAIVIGKEEYHLKPFFYACLGRPGAINYRHEVMHDIENPLLLGCVSSFAAKMYEMRERLVRVQKLHYKEQKQAWFLDAVQFYCEAVSVFADALGSADLKSKGFSKFRDYLTNYVASPPFTGLVSQTENLRAALSTVEYSVLVKLNGFTVRKYEGETDYSMEVEETFDKFKQAAVRDYRVTFSTSDEMNHIEAKILEFIAKLHPEIFGTLERYGIEHGDFVDDVVSTFDREIQFYVAYLDYITVLKRAGLQFCYPTISDDRKEIHSRDGFDCALANKLVKEHLPVVCNDFHLRGMERILVVSGPNQGGKSTFARAFGQLHYLASLGCPVPGSNAQLFLFDRIFTHFEREERVETHRGKLEDDLVRIHDIIDKATPRSIIVLNEIFNSTTLQDEIYLSTKLMQKIMALDLLCIWVTFVDELASFGPQTVSMVSTVASDNPALRTFKIVRRAADGLAYAMAIASKYRLTYRAINERFKS